MLIQHLGRGTTALKQFSPIQTSALGHTQLIPTSGILLPTSRKDISPMLFVPRHVGDLQCNAMPETLDGAEDTRPLNETAIQRSSDRPRPCIILRETPNEPLEEAAASVANEFCSVFPNFWPSHILRYVNPYCWDIH